MNPFKTIDQSLAHFLPNANFVRCRPQPQTLILSQNKIKWVGVKEGIVHNEPYWCLELKRMHYIWLVFTVQRLKDYFIKSHILQTMWLLLSRSICKESYATENQSLSPGISGRIKFRFKLKAKTFVSFTFRYNFSHADRSSLKFGTRVEQSLFFPPFDVT